MAEAQQINPPETGIAGRDVEHMVFQNEQWGLLRVRLTP